MIWPRPFFVTTGLFGRSEIQTLVYSNQHPVSNIVYEVLSTIVCGHRNFTGMSRQTSSKSSLVDRGCS